VRCDADTDLFTATVNGYGKRTPLSEYLVQQDDGTTRCQSRGGKGRFDIKTEGRNGLVVAVRAVTESDQLMLLSREGMVVRIAAAAVSQIGRNTMGVRIMRLGEGAARVAVVPVPTPPSEPPPAP
jgi:DNA gyrase subunit A